MGSRFWFLVWDTIKKGATMQPMTNRRTSSTSPSHRVSKSDRKTTTLLCIKKKRNPNQNGILAHLFGISGDDSIMLEESFLFRLASLLETTIFAPPWFPKCSLLSFKIFFCFWKLKILDFLFALFNGFSFHFFSGKNNEFPHIFTCKRITIG